MFSYDQIELMHLNQKYHKNDIVILPNKVYKTSVYITGDVYY